MLEVAGDTWWSFVAPPRQPPATNRPGLERMKTLTSASVEERENISVPWRDTKTQGETLPCNMVDTRKYKSSILSMSVCQNVLAGGHLHWTAGQTDMLEIFIKTPGHRGATCRLSAITWSRLVLLLGQTDGSVISDKNTMSDSSTGLLSLSWSCVCSKDTEWPSYQSNIVFNIINTIRASSHQATTSQHITCSQLISVLCPPLFFIAPALPDLKHSPPPPLWSRRGAKSWTRLLFSSRLRRMEMKSFRPRG